MSRKLGLVLGAGGAKGLAHIGVLQVLQRENIKIDLLAGSSMGALVGAAYAAGTDIDILEKFAGEINQSLIMDMNLPRVGLLKGDRALELIRLLTHQKNFDALKIPLAVVATDIHRGEPVVFREGNVAQAVRASISIPGVFNPVRINGRLLVDGAVTERLPVFALQEMGADYIIAVDVKTFSQGEEAVKVRNIYDVIMQSIEIMEGKAASRSMEMADCLITPDTRAFSITDFSCGVRCIAAGREAALLKTDQIKSDWSRLRTSLAR
ncbi:MAG: patatin-like phospholipase family protein [Clostridia bacterium]|jgi:NTE family protein|nr:patatin-like phospholipase family protein [Clostridia bacterium]